MSSATWQSRNAAVKEARQFVHSHAYGTLSTINQGNGEFAGYPTGQVEYYSDTGDADATLLMIRVDMSSAFRNIANGSPSEFSIRTGDAPNAVSPLHLAANKRIILYGEFEEAEPTEAEITRFFQQHPDARDWQPGKAGFHRTYWVKFTIVGIYYIGGFGGEHYIGVLPLDKYKQADYIESDSVNSYERSSINEKSPLLEGQSSRDDWWLTRLLHWVGFR